MYIVPLFKYPQLSNLSQTPVELYKCIIPNRMSHVSGTNYRTENAVLPIIPTERR